MKYICIIFALEGIKKFEKLKQSKGFTYSHLTNQEEQLELTPSIENTNYHILMFGSSGPGRTSFLKHYLDQSKSGYIVFCRDAKEFQDNRYVELMQLEKKIEKQSRVNQTIFSGNAGASRQK